MEDRAPLEPIGLGRAETAVYEVLVARPGATPAEVADATLLGMRQVRTALASLEGCGLATRSAGKPQRFTPAPPDVALEALVLQRQEQLERVRVTAQQLTARFRSAQHGARNGEVVEVLTTVDAVVQRFAHLQRRATSEVLILDTPPYRVSDTPPVNDAELEALGRGVSYRVVYDRAALEAMAPDALAEIGAYVAAGEQARLIAALPLKLAIMDRQVAVVPLTVHQVGVERCIVVHPCSLLDALLHIFESLWAQAHRLPAGDTDTHPRPDDAAHVDAQDRQILVLLTAGVKDEAIAHQIGQSHRTVRRRIAALMTALGVETRFQAGVAAARRGWV